MIYVDTSVALAQLLAEDRLFLRDQGVDVSLAVYDRRMIDAAEALEIPLAPC